MSPIHHCEKKPYSLLSALSLYVCPERVLVKCCSFLVEKLGERPFSRLLLHMRRVGGSPPRRASVREQHPVLSSPSPWEQIGAARVEVAERPVLIGPHSVCIDGAERFLHLEEEPVCPRRGCELRQRAVSRAEEAQAGEIRRDVARPKEVVVAIGELQGPRRVLREL